MNRISRWSAPVVPGVFTFIVIATVAACNPAESPTPDTANPGTAGNPCYGNQTCNDGLTCVDGTCRASPQSSNPCGELDPTDCFLKTIEDRVIPAVLDRELDVQKAREMVEAACERGSGMACHALGENYRSGMPYLALQRTDSDQKRALDYFRKACDLGFAVGCYDAATRYKNGGGSPVPVDPEQYFALMQRGCEMGYPPACLEAGKLQRDGDGIEKNETRGAAMLYATWRLTKRTRGNVSFTTLQDKNGKPVARDTATMPTGALLAGYHLDRGDDERAMNIYERACDRGEGVACTQAGARHLRTGSLSSQSDSDLDSALNLLERGCTDHGTASSCLVYVLLDGPKDVTQDAKFDKQLDFLKRACRKTKFACERLGDHYAKSDLANKRQLANKYWEKACYRGRESACDKVE